MQYSLSLDFPMCYFVKALIERGQEATNQTVDADGNAFLHVAARSGALQSIKVSDMGHSCTFVLNSVILQVLMGSPVTEGQLHSENVYQQTALHIAAQHGKLQ